MKFKRFEVSRKYLKTIIWLIVAAHLFIGAGLCRDDYEYIDITNPFLRKIPIAIPVFINLSADNPASTLSKKGADLLSDTLAFTGYFKIMDRDAFLLDPQNGMALSDINFHNWTSIGAELLVTGGVLVKDDHLEMELRLYDTFKAQMLVGKRYKGGVADRRRIVRRFCGEIVYALTGNKGIFDSKIAFVSTSSGHKEIHICDFDGYDPKQLTNLKSITLSPAWSSDGKWLAFTSYTKGKPDLYIQHLTENRRSAISKKGINISPAWVPGKFLLAATLSFSGDPEIYLLTGTGEMVKRLTRKRGIDVSPSFSPNGKQMAFVSKRSGTPQIYIKDIDSGKVNRLTFEGRYNTQPSWSPKGDKIAYSGMNQGRSDIYVIATNGQNLIQLTYNDGNNESASWSPDGSLIVFSSTREGPSRIYVMTAYGTDQRRLLAVPGEQTEPQWSPALSTSN
jgi:TolB protein